MIKITDSFLKKIRSRLLFFEISFSFHIYFQAKLGDGSFFLGGLSGICALKEGNVKRPDEYLD